MAKIVKITVEPQEEDIVIEHEDDILARQVELENARTTITNI